MKFLLEVKSRLKSAPFLCNQVQEHRAVGSLEKLERLNELRQIVPVDRAKVFQSELFKQHGWPQHAFGSFFSAPEHIDRRLSANLLHDPFSGFMQVLVVLVGDHAMKIA